MTHLAHLIHGASDWLHFAALAAVVILIGSNDTDKTS